MNYILASASPRRRELLSYIVKEFSVISSDFNENEVKYTNNPEEYVMDIAEGKAINVYANMQIKENSIIISCDTIVLCDNEVLGKPGCEEDAFFMLKKLSGKTHRVFSGFVVYNTNTGEIIKKSVCTEVQFKQMSDCEIKEYIDKGESLDKAGAYGIQGAAAIYIKGIHGCYYNVVGLPLNELYEVLRGMGQI
ncbi:septum formation protein [Hathewaya proteolytica DSM 3090]|uniref:dTTP/UTP pyrophosphatase n=1 Tax=Hathewaya proteolytica DSM 3090 TaxID=1121331 RepID=A0A1M6JKV6_9CLOT|nr:Maf-like protein [Hathewaya proteolytica]SHJ47319.1 septum formation protein [Hathewaya proteolytica DSM 3090]